MLLLLGIVAVSLRMYRIMLLLNISVLRRLVIGGAGPVAGCDNDWEAESAPTDDCLLYTMLTRPLPDYALHHTFSAYGPVVDVQLQRDPRLAVVKFSNADSARAALSSLNGTNICGEALAVSMVDPLLSSRISKRARVAE